MADALDSGSSGVTPVRVQVPSFAPEPGGVRRIPSRYRAWGPGTYVSTPRAPKLFSAWSSAKPLRVPPFLPVSGSPSGFAPFYRFRVPPFVLRFLAVSVLCTSAVVLVVGALHLPLGAHFTRRVAVILNEVKDPVAAVGRANLGVLRPLRARTFFGWC